MDGYPNGQLLISAGELAQAIAAAAPGPLVLDLRPAEAYAAGHIPGAVHLDLFGLSLIDTDPAPLKAFMWMIEHVLASRGVTSETPVVVYDDQSGIRAARAFWFLEYFGHPSSRLLNGGFGAWSAGGFPVTRDTTPVSASSWTGGRDQSAIASWREVRAAIDQPGAVILDTRSDGEYCGTTVRAARGGAVPGAVHIEWTRNLAPDGTFKPAADLQRMYREAGITPERTVITYCQGGYRAAHSYLALRLLGYPHVRNYVGSWKEWGDRTDLPIEVPNRH